MIDWKLILVAVAVISAAIGVYYQIKCDRFDREQYDRRYRG